MLFSSAKPVSKRVFLDVLHQTSFLTQFFVAPFGLPKSCLDTFGSSSEIGVDVYTEIYHQWEEIVSRVLYSSRGIPGLSDLVLFIFMTCIQNHVFWLCCRFLYCS